MPIADLVAPPAVGAVPFYNGSVWVPRAPAVADFNADASAWVNIPLVAGWVNFAGSTLQVRTIMGGMWSQFRGVVARNSGASETIGTIPVGYRLPADLWVPLVVSGGASYFYFNNGGAITTNGPSYTQWFTSPGVTVQTHFTGLLLPRFV